MRRKETRKHRGKPQIIQIPLGITNITHKAVWVEKQQKETKKNIKAAMQILITAFVVSFPSVGKKSEVELLFVFETQ